MSGIEWVNQALADERIEFRELIRLSTYPEFSSFFKLSSGSVSPDGSAVVGEAGFIFVNDGSNQWRDQLAGNLIIDSNVFDVTINNIRNIKNRLDDLGIIFRMIVIPEKDVIYSHLSPNVSGARLSRRSVDLYLEALGDIIIYPKEDLLDASLLATTYHARNSHYSFFGGYCVAKTVSGRLKGFEFNEALVDSTIISWPDDLSMKWADNFHTPRRILSRWYDEMTLQESQSHVGKYLRFTRKSNTSNKKAIIFGDSYSWNPDAGLARFLLCTFDEIHFLWKKEVDFGLVESIKPDAVFLQSAERFLVKGLL